MERFAWKDDLRQIKQDADEILRLKEKNRHARWYQKNRKTVLKKQKVKDELRDRKTYSKKHYEENKDRIKASNNARYYANLEENRRKARERYHKNKDEINRKRREKRNANKSREAESLAV